MRLLCCLAVLAATTSFAQSIDDKLAAHRQKVAAERHRLGLDKNDKAFGTPAVDFVGTALGDGVQSLLCPGETKTVTLRGVAPKSLVLPTIDDVSITKESWSGNDWTGTLTVKKGAAPRLFSLRGVLASTAQEFSQGSFLIGCKQTLTLEVEGATMVLALDLRRRTQQVTGEWKKGGKAVSSRSYEVSAEEDGLWLRSKMSEQEQMQQMMALQQAMESPRQAALMKKQEALQQKMGACGKLPPAKMAECFKPLEAEARQLGEESKAVMSASEQAGGPAAGCVMLHAVVGPGSTATECAGHPRGDEVKFTWKWSS